MLVITRRQNQKIVFPDLGVSVTLVGARNGSARFGVDAPRDIKILREEICPEDSTPKIALKKSAGAAKKQDQHAMRNVLNSLNLFSLVYKSQLEANQVDEAAVTFMKMVDYLEAQMEIGMCDFEVSSPEESELRGQVMLVEDDTAQRELLSGFLTSKGLDVDAFSNGQDAFQHLKGGIRPGVVLLDWSMPEFGGQWLVPKITDAFGENRPQLFVISGSDNVSKAEREAVDAWLPKPLNQNVLLQRLEAACSVVC